MAKLRREDYGRRLVDEQLEELQEKIANLYTKATYELDEKLSEYFKQYEKRDAEMLAQLAAGEITDKQYTEWRRGTIIGQESWFNMRDKLAQDLTHSDEMAIAMINDTMPSVYSSSYNFGAFMMEEQSAVANVDLSPFTIYNADAVKILMAEDPDLLPSLNVDKNRDLQWNREHIQSAVAQGIIQGDSMDKIASRLQQVTAMDKNAAMRNARTATNGVENAGRQAAADRCVRNGIPMVKEWNAVHDARTRDTHLLIDGEQREEDEKFSNGLLYAGDPQGNPAEVYNCRCATLHFIKGIDHSKDMELYDKFMQEEYYDDWLRAKQMEQDATSHWHMKKLEKEYAEEKQIRLREEREQLRLLKEGKITPEEYEKWKRREWDDTLIWEEPSFLEEVMEDGLENNDIPDTLFWQDIIEAQRESHMLELENENFEKFEYAERAGLERYTGSSYEEMNAYLRYKGAGFSEEEAIRKSGISTSQLESLNAARNGMEKVTIGEDMVLRRGTDLGDIAGAFMTGDFAENKRALYGLTPEELTEKFAGAIGEMFGFTSTSSIYDKGFSGDVEILFFAPANTKGSSIMGISRFGTTEGETLLNAGTKVRFIAAENAIPEGSWSGHKNSRIRIFLEIIP